MTIDVFQELYQAHKRGDKQRVKEIHFMLSNALVHLIEIGGNCVFFNDESLIVEVNDEYIVKESYVQ